MIQLYNSPASAPGLKVQGLLNEIGIPYEHKVVRLDQGEQSTPQFAKISQFKKVPVLVHKGRAISESNTILRYLCNTLNASTWYPIATMDRVEVDMWTDFVSFHITPHFNAAAFQLLHTPTWWGKEPDQVLVKERVALGISNLTQVEKHLLGRNFICGGNPTLADLNLLGYLPALQKHLPMREFPAVSLWLQRMMQRPGIQKAWKDCPFYKA